MDKCRHIFDFFGDYITCKKCHETYDLYEVLYEWQVQAQRIKELEDRNRQLEQQYNYCCIDRIKLERIRDAARNILESITICGIQKCQHGISTKYPTHVWYCDDCWNELKEALQQGEHNG